MRRLKTAFNQTFVPQKITFFSISFDAKRSSPADFLTDKLHNQRSVFLSLPIFSPLAILTPLLPSLRGFVMKFPALSPVSVFQGRIQIAQKRPEIIGDFVRLATTHLAIVLSLQSLNFKLPFQKSFLSIQTFPFGIDPFPFVFILFAQNDSLKKAILCAKRNDLRT